MEKRNQTECDAAHSQERHILRLLALCCGCVSLLLCFFTFSITVLFHKYRSTTQRVFLYLTVTVSLSSLTYILHGLRFTPQLAGNDKYCTFTGFIDQVIAWMVMLAVCCLTFELFVKVVFLKFDTSRYELAYCIIIFIVPLLFNWIPLIHEAYGNAGAYCWIRQTKRSNCSEQDVFPLVLRLILYWIPFFIILLAITVAFIFMRTKASKRLNTYRGNYDPQQYFTLVLINKETRLYLAFPVIMALTFVGALLTRIAQAIQPTDEFIPLEAINIIAFNL